MRYVVGYGRFKIVRERAGEPFRIYATLPDGGIGPILAGGATFHDFASARRECDYLKRR